MDRLHFLTEKLIHSGPSLLRLQLRWIMSTIPKLIVTEGQWGGGEAQPAVMCWNSGSTHCVCVYLFIFNYYLTFEKHFRKKSTHDQITLPITLTNDSLWFLDRKKVGSSSSGMLALVGTLSQTLHLYSWQRLSIVDTVLSSYPKVFSTWQKAFSPLMK